MHKHWWNYAKRENYDAIYALKYLHFEKIMYFKHKYINILKWYGIRAEIFFIDITFRNEITTCKTQRRLSTIVVKKLEISCFYSLNISNYFIRLHVTTFFYCDDPCSSLHTSINKKEYITFHRVYFYMHKCFFPYLNLQFKKQKKETFCLL